MFKNWGLFKYIIKRKILTPYIKVLTKEKAHPKSLIPQYEISKIHPSYNFCESQPMINWPHTNHLLLHQDTSMASISIKQFFFIKHKKKSPFICLSQLLSFQFFFFFHSLIASSTSSVLVVVAFIAYIKLWITLFSFHFIKSPIQSYLLKLFFFTKIVSKGKGKKALKVESSNAKGKKTMKDGSSKWKEIKHEEKVKINYL